MELCSHKCSHLASILSALSALGDFPWPFLHAAIITFTAFTISWSSPCSWLNTWICVSLRVSVQPSWLNIDVMVRVQRKRSDGSKANVPTCSTAFRWWTVWKTLANSCNQHTTNIIGQGRQKIHTEVWTHDQLGIQSSNTQPPYYHQASFANFVAAASNLDIIPKFKLWYFFNIPKDVCPILLRF